MDKHLSIVRGAEVFYVGMMPMLLLFNVMGAKVHNQREVLLMPMVMEMGVEVNNLREML